MITIGNTSALRLDRETREWIKEQAYLGGCSAEEVIRLVVNFRRENPAPPGVPLEDIRDELLDAS